MAATEGNQWWKLRSKHGRNKIFANPDILWEAALEYFETTSKRKWIKKDWVGKDAEMVDRELDVPFTLTGLCVFLDIDSRTWNNYRNDVAYKDFFPIITHIENIIYTQKFEGAANGTFNANIITRDLGITEKTDITTNGENISTPKTLEIIVTKMNNSKINENIQ